MESALATVEFLSRSPHRVAVLDAVVESPHDRAELREATDASSSTIGRILDDFTDRGWVTRVDHRYEATPMGELVGREFTRLLDTMQTVEALHEAVAWLPTEEMGVELGALRDATVTTATESNPFRPILTMAGRLAAADEVRLLAATALPQTLGAIQEAVDNGPQAFEAVVTARFLDAVATDDRMRGQFRNVLDADRTAVFRHDGDVPYDMALVDERVLIAVSDERRVPRALVETDDDSVVSWAESTYASYRRAAEAVAPDRFAV